MNIGLNLKFTRKHEELPGYTRQVYDNWLYSEKAVQLVKQYMDLCPALFEALNYCNKMEDLFKEDVFPTNGYGTYAPLVVFKSEMLLLFVIVMKWLIKSRYG